MSADLERYQQQAAELILDDEGWRGSLPDDVASPLLDWALAQTDAALARRAAGGEGEAGPADAGGAAAAGEPGAEAPGTLEDAAYAAADQARGLLAVLARVCDGAPLDEVRGELAGLMGAPLFESAEEADAAIQAALAAAGGAVPAVPAPEDGPADAEPQPEAPPESGGAARVEHASQEGGLGSLGAQPPGEPPAQVEAAVRHTKGHWTEDRESEGG